MDHGLAYNSAQCQCLNSRIGRSFYAIRENEIAAEAAGINTTRLKYWLHDRCVPGRPGEAFMPII